ncbi:ABC transporter permease [Rugosimonospora acidiphila]|uniref:ABC transporter permease n=1 Tax=Rugosimonospora acidiphila TaxID=556531 RepID=A0ABP9RMY5_9ACTN
MTTTTVEATRALPAARGSRAKAFLRRRRPLLLGTLGILVMLAAWQVCASTGVVDETISSTPLRIAAAEGHLFGSGEIWAPLRLTGLEFGLGLGITIVAGIPIGVLLGRVRFLDEMAQPVINVLNAVPYVMFLPIIIFWFGIGNTSRVLLVVWAGILPLIINTIAGVKHLDRDFVRVAEVFCAGRLFFMRAVALPAALPFILTGVRLALARALVGAIVAELFLASGGLGYFVQTATANFDMTGAMAGIVIMAVVALILTRAIGYLERRLTHWSGSQPNR